MTTKFYVDAGGAYLGGFSGVQPPAGAIEVPAAPEDARQVWDFDAQLWGAAALPVPQIISRRQFYQGLAVAGLISREESLLALTGTLPAALLAIVDGISDEDAAFAAKAHLLASGEFDRTHPLIPVFAASQGMTDNDVDEFWRLCAGLV